MANLVTVDGGRVAFPLLSLHYSITPPISKLQEGLEAYQRLKGDVSLQSLPRAQRNEVLNFLGNFGRMLFRTLFPGGEMERLHLPGPLKLRLDADWCAYPWELLHDGRDWVHLTRGVVRQAGDAGAPTPVNRGENRPLKMMGVSAHPLTESPETPLGRIQHPLGSRFISTLPNPLEHGTDGGHSFQYRLVEHATRQSLAAGFASHPDVIYFSGFADEEGWYLEGETLDAEKAPWPWLLEQIAEGAANALHTVILNDSLGYLSPVTASSRANDLLQTGLPGLVRIEGRLARAREQDYLRRLMAALARGVPLVEAHLNALRNLHERFEAGWDWSFTRLYLPATTNDAPVAAPRTVSSPLAGEAPPPNPPDSVLPVTRSRELAKTEAVVLSNDGSLKTRLFNSFHTPPPPPVFSPRRRFFGRESDLRQLASALSDERRTGSGLHFIEGPPGSGKTMLALELARRLKRNFGQVLYLNGRTLFGDPFSAVAVTSLDSNEPPPGKLLFSELTSHLQAPPSSNGNLAKWRDSIVEHCQDNIARLIVLDRLEDQPGFEEFCQALAKLPPANRVLALCRGQPPLVPGQRTLLTPVSMPDLVRVFGEDFANRLGAADPDGALLDLARRDLFAARLLRRSPLLHQPEELLRALREHEPRPPIQARLGGEPEADPEEAAGNADDETLPYAALPGILTDAALGGLEAAEINVLAVLALFPSLVHREALERGTALNDHRLYAALTRLQWLGWIDAYDGERYFSLHPRIHSHLALRLLTQDVLTDIRRRLTPYYRAFLAALPNNLIDATLERPGRSGGDNGGGSGNGWLHHPPPLLAWAPERCERHPGQRMALLHRLGIERSNLVELALLAIEEDDRVGLEQLAAHSMALERFAELQGVAAFLNHCLLALAEKGGDAQLRARALNRLALPDLKARRGDLALPKLEMALEMLQDSPDAMIEAECLRLLGGCHEVLGQFEKAFSFFHQAADLALKQNRPEDLLVACQGLKRLWDRHPKHHQAAIGFFDRLLGELQRRGHSLHATRLRRLKADLMFQHGHADEAIPLFERVLADCREMEDHRESAITLLRMAACRVRRGDGDEALQLVTEAGAVFGEHTVEAEEQGRLLTEICRFFEERDQPEQALRGYLYIRRILEEIGDREALIAVLDRIGGLYFQMGEQAKSTECYQERLQLQAALMPS
ncbi:MAG: AAA family ATPase [bacterium]